MHLFRSSLIQARGNKLRGCSGLVFVINQDDFFALQVCPDLKVGVFLKLSTFHQGRWL